MSVLPFVILASGSPRRRQLLQQMGAEFTVTVPSVEESPLPGEQPGGLVERLALAKAAAVAETATPAPFAQDEGSGTAVLGSDTVVVLDNDILGKPADMEEAREMLRRLSGRTHTVFTGFALIDIVHGGNVVSHERTEVTFRTLDEDEIARYVATGAPLDKAGAYGIQDDFGAVFIERINGDYYTVVGLPLARVYTALREMGRSSRS